MRMYFRIARYKTFGSFSEIVQLVHSRDLVTSSVQPRGSGRRPIVSCCRNTGNSCCIDKRPEANCFFKKERLVRRLL
jgi:hypothetical protein